MRYKGIIFDLDSTLIHSMVDFPKMKTKMIGILEENGVPRGVLSPTSQTTVEILENAERYWRELGKPEEERAELREKMEYLMNEGELEAVENIEEVPGASLVIQKLKKKGYKLAILTRSHHEYSVAALRKTGMLDFFDVVLARGETPEPKPSKEALIHTAYLLGLEIEDVVFVGDHQIDADCARNADCHFIGVATGRRGVDSWEGNLPDILLDNVTKLPEYLSLSECPDLFRTP